MTSTLPLKYAWQLRVLHWAMLLLFLVLFITGFIMVDLEKTDPLKADLFGLHKSIGVFALLSLLARLVVRRKFVVPAPDASLTASETKLSLLVHAVLYGFMLIVPITGWLVSDLHGRGVKLFGLPLPKLFPTVADIGGWPGLLHTVLAYSLLALAILHILAVIKHRFVDHRSVLHRMI